MMRSLSFLLFVTSSIVLNGLKLSRNQQVERDLSDQCWRLLKDVDLNFYCIGTTVRLSCYFFFSWSAWYFSSHLCLSKQRRGISPFSIHHKTQQYSSYVDMIWIHDEPNADTTNNTSRSLSQANGRAVEVFHPQNDEGRWTCFTSGSLSSHYDYVDLRVPIASRLRPLTLVKQKDSCLRFWRTHQQLSFGLVFSQSHTPRSLCVLAQADSTLGPRRWRCGSRG